MDDYSNLKRRFNTEKDDELESVQVLSIDFSASYWDTDECAENARKTLISLDRYAEIGDQYFNVIWTKEVLEGLAELAELAETRLHEGLTLVLRYIPTPEGNCLTGISKDGGATFPESSIRGKVQVEELLNCFRKRTDTTITGDTQNE